MRAAGSFWKLEGAALALATMQLLNLLLLIGTLDMAKSVHDEDPDNLAEPSRNRKRKSLNGIEVIR